LASGVPIEVVQKVTGHKVVQTVLTHYFQPGRQNLREILGQKLPQLLIGSQSAAENPEAIVRKLRLVVDQLQPENATSLRAELVQLLDQLRIAFARGSNAA
jgi:hypothetical protein